MIIVIINIHMKKVIKHNFIICNRNDGNDNNANNAMMNKKLMKVGKNYCNGLTLAILVLMSMTMTMKLIMIMCMLFMYISIVY